MREESAVRRKTLAQLNQDGVRAAKSGDHVTAVAAFSHLIMRTQSDHITHGELHVCYSNRAASHLALDLFSEALNDAERCISLMLGSSPSSASSAVRYSPVYVKALLRKGRALMGLGCTRDALSAFQEGLRCDPFHADLRRDLDAGHKALLEDVLTGKNLQLKALPPSGPPSERITYHPHSMPLHRIAVDDDDRLPSTLLTAFQAERDHAVRDSYNYATIQADVAMPKRHLAYLADKHRLSKMEAAVARAVQRVVSEGKDCRVLLLGAGAGYLAIAALKAGAAHVTCVERWLYLASSCKEVLDINQVPQEQYKILYKRPCDLVLLKDVPICCNVVVCDMIDDGLLGCGLIPAVTHAAASLATHDAVFIPSSATVMAQAVQLATPAVAGFDVSAVDAYRWFQSQQLPCQISAESQILKQLSDPQEAWYFDLACPPDCAARKTLDLTFTQDGIFSGVMFWYRLQLGCDDLMLDTGAVLARSFALPGAPPAGTEQDSWEVCQTLQPAYHPIAGRLKVQAGTMLPLLACHNTARMTFEIEEAEYEALTVSDPTFPPHTFAMLADNSRVDAYQAALQRAVLRLRETGSEAVVLDLGSGTGVLALAAAAAGACTVSVIQADVSALQQGRDVPFGGANIAVFDLFDAGLLGHNVLGLLDAAKRTVMQSSATIIPCAASVWVCAAELLTRRVSTCHTTQGDSGVNCSPLNKYRHDDAYETLHVEDLVRSGAPFRLLSQPVRALEVDFTAAVGGAPPSSQISVMNAVLFWFDLDLDSTTQLTNCPHAALATLLAHTQQEHPTPVATVDSSNHEPPYDENKPPNSSAVTLPSAEPSEDNSLKSSERENSDVSSLACAEQTPSSSQQQQQQPRHHWGQALQYLDCALPVQPGSRVPLILNRDGSKLHFTLRPGVGLPVPRPPWKIEWGGGSSVENPHFQRLHYCKLLIADFLQRLPSGRFPSVAADMKILSAHCGSLFLDPQALAETTHTLTLLESLFKQPHLVPGVLPEAVSHVWSASNAPTASSTDGTDMDGGCERNAISHTSSQLGGGW
ncbi:MAG: hypothetical protein WDW38_010893 [Sanguina aurantia]